MLDVDRIYLWAWDARPYPAFPNLKSVWSDGDNYATGHWLNGRLGALGAAEILQAAANDYGTSISAAYSGGVKVDGFQIENMTALRGAIEPLLEVSDLNILDRPQGLVAVRADDQSVVTLSHDDCVADGDALLQRKHPDASAAVGQLGLNYLDRQRAYMTGTATARALSGDGGTAFSSGLVIEPTTARRAVEQVLGRMSKTEDVLEFALPHSQLALEVGDVFDFEGQLDGPFVVTEIRDGLARRVVARAIGNNAAFALGEEAKDTATSGATVTGVPFCVAAHIPLQSDGFGASQLMLGAVSIPWPGEVSIEEETTGSQLARLTQSATLGGLLQPLPQVSGALWDKSSQLSVEIYDGHLSSVTQAAALAGSNRAAIERDDGSWEIIGFANAELVSENTYLLTHLLRGLNGTDAATATISADARFMLLDNKLASIEVRDELLGGNFALKAYAGAGDSTGTDFSAALSLDPLLTLAPAHLHAERDIGSNDITLSWVRRARRDGNSWALVEVPLDNVPESYRIEIYDAGTLVRTFESATTSQTYLASEQSADFGAPPASFDFTIAQISPSFGVGHAASGEFNG